MRQWLTDTITAVSGRVAGALSAFAGAPAPAPRHDGWGNPVSGLGTARDRLSYHQFTPDAPLSDVQLEALYQGDDFAARIVDAVPEHALKLGYQTIVQMSEDEAEDELDEVQELGTAIHEYVDEWCVEERALEADIWGRCYGGSAVMIGANDGRSPDQPLNEEGIESIDFLKVIDRRSLTVDRRYTGRNRQAGEPETYRLHRVGTPDDEIAKSPIIHESRMVVFPGVRTSRLRKWQQGGWDDSVLQRAYTPLLQCNANWQSICHLLSDASQGVFSMKDYAALVRARQHAAVLERLADADLHRSVNRMMVVDAKDEKFERVSSQLQGIPDLADKNWIRLAACAQIPVTVLMGQSPTGFDATGESDLTWWYDLLRKHQQQVLRPRVKRLTVVLLRAKNSPTGGRVPARLGIAFPPLWQGTPKDRAALIDAQSKADERYIGLGVFTPSECGLSRFTDTGYSLETSINRRRRREVLSQELERIGQPQSMKAAPPEPAAPANAA